MAAFLLIVLSFFFAPFYIRSRVATLPDFLEKRYSRASRDWLAVLSIFSAIFIHIGFSLYTGAVVLKGLFGIDINVSIVLTAVLTGLYTIVGGLLAVVLTESVQTVILIAGAACVVVIGLVQAGGWSGMAASVEPVKLIVLRTAAQTPTLPWYAVFLGYPVIGLWYWCADQTIVQRVLGALNSIATLFSLDLYKRWRPASSEKKLTRIGRVVTFVAMVAAILWSPFPISSRIRTPPRARRWSGKIPWRPLGRRPGRASSITASSPAYSSPS